ncbi:helix-turn-helix domain-containing protein [Finegoldia sp. BIOML-A2]|uniref:Transcriptional regulator n=1 Tax=Finegoldia magna TaxID=1260 RepID=A0A233VQC8_FINMA|nr:MULTISPECIES: helix-turn-helix transcriptional regulator [Finegoldia]MBS5964685.1 helix-turn-helix transcriptional regulator [Finegoldia magna]MDU1580129.1 helix-turn-helix transcriptional regulator [Finegoldia magna]MDU1600865.1 helix-turn-helix transcriptional regulator [Finegoldia magna]MDU5223896.1 helix-turn-helix transcriptional regulator [Finegoldia magna]MDU5236208.1 helix-turn-helix transcriptional regulator [Finegoldia magna]
MRVNYNGLWKILIDNNMKKTDLQEIANIAPATIAKMGKGEFVSMETLYKVCKAFNVDFGDIVSIC